MKPILYAAIAAAGNLLGALALATRDTWSRRTIEFVLAFSAGFLVAVSLGELVPEAISRGGLRAGAWILTGFVLVHLTQHALVGHFHFGEETHEVSGEVGITALVGLMLHTFVDGVAIATSLAVDQRLGALVLTAIVLHKLPEGLAIGSLFVAGGRSVRAAVVAALALGVATIAGAALSDRVALLATHGLALAAGVTLYVGASNLIPEFQGKRGWSHNFWFFAGVAGYALVAFIG
ncbi:MAG: ZIP family metal transporter [Gemmatimonadaceae bacterium]|nr:ZIP family metal transporter [Gemmatimonadaceae bacterium]